MGYQPYGYGPMMPQQPHHMGGHGGHGMGHSRGMGGGGGGGGGMVPFRAGDWKCGAEGCGYHNFAKNVSCLRCGASRSTAAVVAESGFSSPMEGNSQYGMGPSSVGGTPGPGSFAAPASGFGNGSFPGQHYGGPQSSYALPSGLGAPTGPYLRFIPILEDHLEVVRRQQVRLIVELPRLPSARPVTVLLLLVLRMDSTRASRKTLIRFHSSPLD